MVDPDRFYVDISITRLASLLGFEDSLLLKRDVPNTGSCQLTIPVLNFTQPDDVVYVVGIQVILGRSRSVGGSGGNTLMPADQIQIREELEEILVNRVRGLVRRWTTTLYYSFSDFLRARCQSWCASQPANIGQEILRNVLPCPPTVNRARFDNAFREDTGVRAFLNGFFHPGTATCFRQVRWAVFHVYHSSN